MLWKLKVHYHVLVGPPLDTILTQQNPIYIFLPYYFNVYFNTPSLVIFLLGFTTNYFVTMLIKIQPDATLCRYLFTAKLLYMFRVSQHPSSGVLKTVTAASGTGHTTGTATSLRRGLILVFFNGLKVNKEGKIFLPKGINSCKTYT